jgi:hypothetical protein
VSFGEHQAAVERLTPNTPVLLMREPENEFDAGAVRAITVAGTPLGYLPRQTAYHFTSDTTAARVDQAGRNAAGVAWATVGAVPDSPGLLGDLHGPAPPNLSTALPGAWELLRAKASAASGGRCAVCGGVGTTRAVEAHESWHFDCRTRSAQLTGISALCPACHGARHARRATQKLSSHVAEVNKWSAEEATAYLQWLAAERQRRTSLGVWKLDLGWLAAQAREARAAGEKLWREAADEGTLEEACKELADGWAAEQGPLH